MENGMTNKLEAEFCLWIEEAYGPVEEMNEEQLDELRMSYFAGVGTFLGILVRTFVTERQLISKRQFENIIGEVDLYVHDLLQKEGAMQ
jgi:hypothetical protein